MSAEEGAGHALPTGWMEIEFAHFLTPVDRKFLVVEDEAYQLGGVRLYGNGLFVRESKLGAEIVRKQQWWLRRGDVVYNKLFAWRGTFAVAGIEHDGLAVPDKFTTYRLNAEVIDPTFLSFYFRSRRLWRQARVLSKGAAALSKLTLNPPQFRELTIPAPKSLKEQRRIASILGATSSFVEAIREREIKAERIAAHILSSLVEQLTSEFPRDAALGDVLVGRPRNGWSPHCDNADEGTPVLSLGAVTGFEYLDTEFKRTSEIVDPTADYWLSPGDLLLTRSNTLDLVGHAAIYSGVPTPCIYPDLMMRIVINDSVADKKFVHWWLRSQTVRRYMRIAAVGTSSTMRKINAASVRRIPFPRLSQDRQVALVSQFEAVKQVVDRIITASNLATASSAQVVDAMIERAYRGEL